MPTFSTHTVPSSVIGACNDAPDLQASGGLKSETHNHSSSGRIWGSHRQPKFISNKFFLAHLPCLLLLLSECVSPTFRAGKCVCKVHSDWWHSVFHLENTSWSVPGANSDITPAGNKHGWMANLALSLSSRIFYSGIKLTSDNDKT